MKNNKDIIIICATIALCILAIDIILTFIAGLYSFCAILIILFIISLIVLIVFATKKDKILKNIRIEDLPNVVEVVKFAIEEYKAKTDYAKLQEYANVKLPRKTA